MVYKLSKYKHEKNDFYLCPYKEAHLFPYQKYTLNEECVKYFIGFEKFIVSTS